MPVVNGGGWVEGTGVGVLAAAGVSMGRGEPMRSSGAEEHAAATTSRATVESRGTMSETMTEFLTVFELPLA